MRTKELFNFIRERHRIYIRRFEQGLPKPWTKDPILQNYRFCNVYRELDTVTKWIATNWRTPHAETEHLWFAMAVARLVNWPDTLDGLTPVIFKNAAVTWSPEKFVRGMHKRAETGVKVFSGAYIVSTNGRAMDKAEYLAQHVLTPLWQFRKAVAPRGGDTLDAFHRRLTQFDGMGSFLAAQVVADIKYVDPLFVADDWWTWAASGPGSRRGLNRVLGADKDMPRPEDNWRWALCALLEEVQPLIAREGMPELHAQDLQNCLCEFDKYERTRLGEGRPRSKYEGA